MSIKNNIIFFFQIIILEIAYFLINIFYKNKKNLLWIIGTQEIANNINFLGEFLSPSITVNLYKHAFYAQNKYDFTMYNNSIFKEMLFKPLLLAYLASRGTHFFYIWDTGFLKDRRYELKFLNKRGKKIVCMFVGSEIRAPKLVLKLMEEIGVDRGIRYHANGNPNIFSDENDQKKRRLAHSADKYADLIISVEVDQKSYIQKQQHPFIYIYPKEKFLKNPKKFENIKKIKILHAPSNPYAKGTPLVRAALKKLQLQGYIFEYTELQGMPNSEVLQHLNEAHIAMVEFFPYTLGLFAIESMANNCAVMTSADASIETSLPSNSKDAWVITKHWEIYDKLKYLLDDCRRIKYYADIGYDFAYSNYNSEAASQSMNKLLKDEGII